MNEPQSQPRYRISLTSSHLSVIGTAVDNRTWFIAQCLEKAIAERECALVVDDIESELEALREAQEIIDRNLKRAWRLEAEEGGAS